MNQPWTFEQATANCRAASAAQQSAEEELRRAFRAFAEAEERYRKALAVEIVKAHADGVAWSTAPDLARGDDGVARLRRERDIAEGVKEAMQQAVWRHTANRRDAQRFAEWSMRRNLAEGHEDPVEPAQMVTYGRRAA